MKIVKIYISDNPKNSSIVIPNEFAGKSRLKVTFEDVKESYSSKTQRMKEAASDTLLMDDISEISSDFEEADFTSNPNTV